MKRRLFCIGLAWVVLTLCPILIIQSEARVWPAGTGVIVHSDGYILTANHVIAHARRIVVVTSGESRVPATIVSINEGQDLALLKVHTDGLFEAPLGYAETVHLDQEMLAVGFPFGLPEVSVSRGRITAVRAREAQTVFQIDAAINPGNSGGPLFNLRGEVVGVITNKFSHPSGISPEGMGFALPISFATPLLANIPNFDFAGIGKNGTLPSTEKKETRLVENIVRATVRIEIERVHPPNTVAEGPPSQEQPTETLASATSEGSRAPRCQTAKENEKPDGLTDVNTALKQLQKEELARLAVQGTQAPKGMVLIPGGTFQRGADDGLPNSRPMRSLYVSSFWIDQYEVTNKQYHQCVQAGVCSPPKAREAFDNPDRAQHPVMNITWLQARTYCHWTGQRLPTEAEWEKAARGIDGRRYSWGNQEDPLRDWLNPHENGMNGHGTLPVGSLSDNSSPYGVVDLVGNVWEWVNDWYAKDYYNLAPSRNPQGPIRGSFRVLRGGDWSQSPLELQTSYRGWDEMTYWAPKLGFRCAADIPDS